MKNLLLILSFLLISLTGYSQTYSVSSNTAGTTHNTYTVSIPQGNGYNYSYSITATNSTVYIISQYRGTLGMLSNPTANQQQTAGAGNVSGGSGGSGKQYQDVIHLVASNGTGFSYGYAQISVNPY